MVVVDGGIGIQEEGRQCFKEISLKLMEFLSINVLSLCESVKWPYIIPILLYVPWILWKPSLNTKVIQDQEQITSVCNLCIS